MKVDPQSLGKVGVLFGGRSAEREVSLMSGQGVLDALKSRGVDAHAFDPGRQSLAELEAAGFDRVFIALHGRFGEDGTIQGALELMGIPYTGSGVMASAIAIDKITTKRIWRTEGIPTPQWRIGASAMDWASVFEELGEQLIVKPAREGSSLGLSKVQGRDPLALARAFEKALACDDHVLIEEMVVGRELTVTLLGEGESAHALPIIEIRAPGADYDFHHKYYSDDTQYLCPAPIAPELAAEIQRVCVDAYRVLGARGWGRIDVMLREDGSFSLLELNTSPGMTGHSLVPMAARAVGMSYEDLVLHIAASATLENRA